MKKFLIQTFLFGLCALCIVVALLFLSRAIVRNMDLSIPEDKRILVIGNSHTECAINDTIYKPSVNLSLSARDMHACYILIKDLIERNPHIETVVLSMSPKILDAGKNLSRFNDNPHFKYHLSQSALRADMHDLALFFKLRYAALSILRAPAYLENTKLFFKIFSGQLSPDVNKRHVGAFMANYANHMQSDIKKRSNEPRVAPVIDTESMSYAYMSKIQSYLSKRDVKLVLMFTPHYRIDHYCDRAFFNKEIKEKFPDVQYVDFSDFPLSDSCYSDTSHLNVEGARIFSEYLEKHGLFSYKSSSASKAN